MIMTTCLVAMLSPLAASAAPTSDSSFAGSLSAGAAKFAASFTAMVREEDTLLDLLRDSDIEVRRQAVRSLKNWVHQRSSTRDRVLALYRSGSEDLSVRREAAKTLSVVSGYTEVYNALINEAQRGSEQSLRAISWKSLYWTASQRSDVRDALLDAARRETDPVVRRAAIWALFATSNDNRVQDQLSDLARRDHDSAVRVEALKSLYSAMGDSQVRDLAYDIARRENDAAVRRAAILMHSFRVTSTQEDLLQDIARRDSSPEMRRAATLALGGANSEEIRTFFHVIRRDRNGVLVGDPLDAE